MGCGHVTEQQGGGDGGVCAVGCDIVALPGPGNGVVLGDAGRAESELRSVEALRGFERETRDETSGAGAALNPAARSLERLGRLSLVGGELGFSGSRGVGGWPG